MTKQNEQQKQWARIVAKAWADEEYKQKLLADPAAVLKSEGVSLLEGVNLKCMEASENEMLFVLPPKPDMSGDSVQDLEKRLAAVALPPLIH